MTDTLETAIPAFVLEGLDEEQRVFIDDIKDEENTNRPVPQKRRRQIKNWLSGA